MEKNWYQINIQVESSTFTINDDDSVKEEQLGGSDSTSQIGDLVPTFMISLFKDSTGTTAVTTGPGELLIHSLRNKHHTCFFLWVNPGLPTKPNLFFFSGL